MTTKKTDNINGCSRFSECSANVCPFNINAEFTKNLPDESRCAYTIDRKDKTEKGIKTLMPTELLKLVPIRNIKLLNKRNRKRWQGIYK